MEFTKCLIPLVVFLVVNNADAHAELFDVITDHLPNPLVLFDPLGNNNGPHTKTKTTNFNLGGLGLNAGFSHSVAIAEAKSTDGNGNADATTGFDGYGGASSNAVATAAVNVVVSAPTISESPVSTMDANANLNAGSSADDVQRSGDQQGNSRLNNSSANTVNNGNGSVNIG